ncbi:PREDICTED: uncharacterized protein LOC109147101 [Ipomoea nil]|uniref:uncharacterized protein LOC109147101 n=1 Tax=Ipomoea nil TaxID=35883 RepID=UPI000900A5EE|nr:PREDICTED: uncharacterized protein LOC109147101 [Ipomoea nil]
MASLKISHNFTTPPHSPLTYPQPRRRTGHPSAAQPVSGFSCFFSGRNSGTIRPLAGSSRFWPLFKAVDEKMCLELTEYDINSELAKWIVTKLSSSSHPINNGSARTDAISYGSGRIGRRSCGEVSDGAESNDGVREIPPVSLLQRHRQDLLPLLPLVGRGCRLSDLCRFRSNGVQ